MTLLWIAVINSAVAMHFNVVFNGAHRFRCGGVPQYIYHAAVQARAR